MPTPLKRGMPCNPCCGPSGLTVCGCTDVPTTLHATMTYSSYPGPDAYGNCNSTELTSKSFALTYNSGTLIIGIGSGGSTLGVMGFWVSDCIATGDRYACACQTNPVFKAECTTRFFLYCNSGIWKLGSKYYNAGGISCTGDPMTGPQFNDTFALSLSGACSPFSWSSGTAGANGYALITS